MTGFEPGSSGVRSSHSSNHATKPLRPTWGFQSKDFFEQNSLRQFISGDHFCIWKYLEKDKTISSRESLFLVPITSVISAIDNVGTIRSFCDQDRIEKCLRRDHRDICSSVRKHLFVYNKTLLNFYKSNFFDRFLCRNNFILVYFSNHIYFEAF